MKGLLNVQAELKAPKGNFNSFGKYKYRSCEDILEAVKPLLAKEGLTLTLSDELIQTGERYYVKATARIADGQEVTEVTAYAREAAEKKGMDDSQITGTASSYARKYALNGLFLIDDTKDADTDEYTARTQGKAPEQNLATDLEKKTFMDRCKELGVDCKEIAKQAGVTGRMTKEQHGKCLVILKEIEEGAKQ